LTGWATLRIAARIVLTFGTGISTGSPFFGCVGWVGSSGRGSPFIWSIEYRYGAFVNAEPSSEQPTQEQAVQRADLPLMYANWMRLMPAPLDVALDVGYFAPDTPPHPQLRIVMTWEHVKMLQGLITAIVEQREGNFGEIALPDGITIVRAGDGEDES
jgi:hypothetical protein